MSEKISVVVVGGGAAATTVAAALDKTLDPSRHSLTLITESDYLRHHPAALRAIVTAEGNLEDQICIPYDKVFGKDKKGGAGRVGTVKFGKVISIEENANEEGGAIVLENNERVKWDYLTIATGSEWNGPLRWPTKREEVKSYLDNWRERLATAKSVLLVGSGAVGSELAGEIVEFFPSTEVTVVNRNPLPLNETYPDSFRERVKAGLTGRGVKFIGGDSVSSLAPDVLNGTESVSPGRSITTDKGVKVAADLIIPTTGRRGVNTHFLGASSSPSAANINKSLVAGGHLDVLATLQLKTNPRVFAAGDVVALPEQHTLIKAANHAPVVAANIFALIQANGDNKKALKNYTKAMDAILITNGRTRGVMYVDLFRFFGRPIIFGDWLSAKLKSNGLLIGMAKGMMNQD